MDGESLQRGALRIVATRGTAYSHPTCTTASVKKELDVGAGNLSEFSESPPRVPWKASNTCHTPSPNSDANLNSTTATPFRSELEEELAKLKEEDDLLESLRCEIKALLDGVVDSKKDDRELVAAGGSTRAHAPRRARNAEPRQHLVLTG